MIRGKTTLTSTYWSPRVSPRKLSAFLAQPEDLSGLRARWNAQLGLAANCRHLDLRAQRRLGQRDGNDAINVVSLAREYRCGATLVIM